MRIPNFYTFLVIGSFAFIACKNTPDQNLGLEEDFTDFQQFYEQFHQDSVYQMEHITFPLQGVPDNVANAPNYSENFTFSPETWVLNRPIDLEKSHFQRSLRPIGTQLIIEQLIHESGSYGMERRFAKIDGEWMLIYYQGINPINRDS